MIASAKTIEANPSPRAEPRPRPRRRRPPEPTVPPHPDQADENLYLIGRPTLKRFLRFVRKRALDPPDEGTLTDEWQAANEVVRALEKEEAGAADSPPIPQLEVTPENEPWLTQFLEDPLVQNSFNTVPTEVAFVELDRLVVYQHHIDLTYVRLLERAWGPSPSPEQIFRACLLHEHPRPPVKWSRAHGNSFVFVSPSNDLRFLGAMKLRREHITGYPPPGDLAGVVGLAFGFGSNFLNAIHAENRLILNNGSHRAYALRKLGIRHAPCIVQHVSSREKLEVIAASAVATKPDDYLRHPRPAMLKDYFDPRLHKVMPVHRQIQQVTLKFEIDQIDVPAL
ncbi:MAG: hypothetical protein KGS61_21090 [Verrucomicrobia bacterium]|nr:hypothetical protein [Verrucomicrobiota bacterium]